MNILNWILFILLNVCLTSGVSGFRLFTNVAIWVFFIEKFYDYGLAFLWILLTFTLQQVFLLLLYEFLNKKSQIFLFLNKQKILTFRLKSLFIALFLDVVSFFIISKLWETYFLLFFFLGNLFISYFGLAIWLRLRKCILLGLRKIIKSIGKWLSKRKFATLQNIIIFLHLIFVTEVIPFFYVNNSKTYLSLISFIIIPLVLVELISLLSYAKKQKAQPFQRGVIFIISLLIFIYTQIAISILFLVDLI